MLGAGAAFCAFRFSPGLNKENTQLDRLKTFKDFFKFKFSLNKSWVYVCHSWALQESSIQSREERAKYLEEANKVKLFEK